MKSLAEQLTPPIKEDSGSRSPLQTLILLLATMSGLILCYRLAEPLLPALVWATTLAVIFAPFQRWMESKLPPAAASTIAVLLVGLAVGALLVLVGQQLVRQAAIGAELVDAKIKSGEWRETLQSQPRIAAVAEQIEHQINLPDAADSIASWLTTAAGKFVKGSVAQVVSFCLTFYLLFYFLRDRRSVLVSGVTSKPASVGQGPNSKPATASGTLGVIGG